MEDAVSLQLSDIDIIDWERRFKETLLELQSKRVLLTEKNKELQQIIAEKSQLHQDLEKSQHEKKYLENQLDEMKQISKQREEEWSKFRDNWAQNKIKFEICTKTTDAIKLQLSNQQQEISKLKSQKEELERQVRESVLWKEKCLVTQTRVENTIETLIRQIRTLEQDHIKLNSSVKAAVIVANKTENFKSNCEKSLKQYIEENESLNRKVVELSVQLQEFDFPLKKETNEKDDFSQDDVVKTFNEWKKYQDENHKDALENLDKIKEAFDCIEKLQTIEKKAMETINNLEHTLHEERAAHKKPKVSDFSCQVTILEDNTLSENNEDNLTSQKEDDY
ncbi:uncharacterized protein LOC142320245 [Lycorma delicatula]|uniref:uncharacterized protein LOC142320245 n=1 Tax=Lycorma delicatula TaxID=130591 RepID=UPI003F51AB84